MTATVPSPLPIDCALPDWLTTCLLTHQHPGSNEEPTDESDDKSNSLLVCRAFEFAYELHKGQYRASGEPYICHPVAVAGLLRDLGGDSAMIASGFLHDVVEDTDVTPEEIEEHFGEEVRQLVEGVTKLSKFNFESKTERQAENFRRMFLAMAQDIRVIVVKLADRLSAALPGKPWRSLPPWPTAWGSGASSGNWRTCPLNTWSQRLTAKSKTVCQKSAAIAKVVCSRWPPPCGSAWRPTLNVAEVSGRPKHLYGIHRKMERQQKAFHEIFDIAAVRDCWDPHQG
jgi:guanosine-3',5'-bis(diphosphate) 3'-pyrophosphohydrolase